MSRMLKRLSRKVAQAPGTLTHVGEPQSGAVKTTLIQYDGEQFREESIQAEKLAKITGEPGQVTWVNLDGLHKVEHIETLGRAFGIHSLVLEDVLNTAHRPKIETFDDYIFAVVKMLTYEPGQKRIHSEQVSLILGPDYVISFQEKEGDVFEPVRQRLRQGRGRIRKQKADYLFYALMDVMVDNYYLVLEGIGEQLEGLEDGLLEDPDPEVLHILFHLKRELNVLRSASRPLREAVVALQDLDTPLIGETTLLYSRDLYDHIVQVIHTGDTFREVIASIHDLYMSSVSNKMNQVMKVLTIIATIFIPLTFIAGIYGMNFEFMPELKLKYGYFTVWGVMILLGAAMVVLFKRKKWL